MSYKYNLRTGVIRVKTKTSVALSTVALGVIGAILAALMPLSASAAGSSYSLFGDAQIVSPGHNSAHAVQTTSSSTAPGYGGVDFGVPAGVTNLSSLNNLSTDYMFTAGSCGGGSPRFSVTVQTPSGPSAFFYIGPAPSYSGCPQNVWLNSGNLASPANLVDASQLGGTFYEPYATVQASYGSYTVTDIALVTDAGWAFPATGQTVQFDNTQINNNTYTYDQPQNKDDCKNDGWQTVTDQNGMAFKNQGQCVSWTNGRGQ